MRKGEWYDYKNREWQKILGVFEVGYQGDRVVLVKGENARYCDDAPFWLGLVAEGKQLPADWKQRAVKLL